MVDHLERLASALHRAGGGEAESRRLLELAAAATMRAAAIEALAREEPEARPPAAPGIEPFRLAA